MSEKAQKISVIILLAAIWFIAVFVRLQITGFFTAAHGELPFTSESALHFRYASMAASGQKIPSIDTAAQYPEGLPVFRKLSMGGGIFLVSESRPLCIKDDGQMGGGVLFNNSVQHF